MLKEGQLKQKFLSLTFFVFICQNLFKPSVYTRMVWDSELAHLDVKIRQMRAWGSCSSD